MMMHLKIALVLVALSSSAFCLPMGADVFSWEELERYFGVTEHDKAPEYELVYPQLVESESKRSIGAEALAAQTLTLEVNAFGETLHLSLAHDDSNFAEGLQAEHVAEDGTSFTVPVRTDCVYTGKVEGEDDSVASVTTCNGLMAVIFRKKGALYIEPLDKVHAEQRETGLGLPHVAYRNVPMEHDDFCQVEDPTHLVHAESAYQQPPSRDRKRSQHSLLMQTPIPIPVKHRPDSRDDVNSEDIKYIELAFIADSALTSIRGIEQTTTCVTTLFNAVKNLYQDSSLLGTNIAPKLVHVKIFGPTETGLQSNTDGLTYLQTCTTWHQQNNFPSSDDRHWDNAVFLTGVDLKYNGNPYLLGIAYVSQCGSYGTGLSEFRGLYATLVTAHELGHNLGMSHDGSDNTCLTNVNIMSPIVIDYREELAWSTCSQAYITDRLAATTCYDDA